MTQPITTGLPCPSCHTPTLEAPAIGAFCPNPTCARIDDLTPDGEVVHTRSRGLLPIKYDGPEAFIAHETGLRSACSLCLLYDGANAIRTYAKHHSDCALVLTSSAQAFATGATLLTANCSCGFDSALSAFQNAFGDVTEHPSD